VPVAGDLSETLKAVVVELRGEGYEIVAIVPAGRRMPPSLLIAPLIASLTLPLLIPAFAAPNTGSAFDYFLALLPVLVVLPLALSFGHQRLVVIADRR
jgi:hypothetical protein